MTTVATTTPATIATGAPHSTPVAPSAYADSYSSLLHTLLTINVDRKIRLGIETTRSLLDALGPGFDLDASRIPCIHVAGSNGKGSVVMKVAQILEAHGLKVGMYTSPHISSYRERIQVNGEIISEESLCTLLPHILSVTRSSNIPATFFELGTALAFGHFIRSGVDVAVIEVGLGGRLDSTNVLQQPALSIITSISLEHTMWLGDTIEAITREKAGIIKSGCPVLIGPGVRKDVVATIARDKSSGRLEQLEQVFDDYDRENSAMAKRAIELVTEDTQSPIAKLIRAHRDQRKTATSSSSTSLASSSSSPSSSVDTLVDPVLVDRAIRVRPPCRFQHVRWYGAEKVARYVPDEETPTATHSSSHALETPSASSSSHAASSSSSSSPPSLDFILDVCHNPAAFSRLFEKLSQSNLALGSSHRSAIGIVGFSSDKDIAACMGELMAHCTDVFVVSADTPRAATIAQVLDAVERDGLRKKFPQCRVRSIATSAYDTINMLIEAAASPSSSSSLGVAFTDSPAILCCGTFFIMADVRRALALPHPIDQMQINEQSMKKG